MKHWVLCLFLLGFCAAFTTVNAAEIKKTIKAESASPAKTESKEKSSEFPFQKLKNTEASVENSYNPEVLKDKDSVWIVFQKDCATCHKVMKESRCYQKKNKVEVLALGLYETPKNLLQDARKSGFKGPVLVSEEAVDKKFDLDVTPTTFVMRKNKLVQRFDAYVSCAQIKKALSQY